MNFNYSVTAALVIWNLFTLSIMGIDKQLAINKKYRIDEKTLFLSAFLFGAVGIYSGMYLFRHKTNHWQFKIFVPLGIIFNIVALYLYLK